MALRAGDSGASASPSRVDANEGKLLRLLDRAGGDVLGGPRAPAVRRAASRILLRSALAHWARAVRNHPGGVLVLSPYLTGDTCNDILRHAEPGGAEIYTVFEARLFAMGASSISALKRLVQAGHRVFHLPGLHAKVVLTSGVATVGSQNLTARGQRAREATAVFWDTDVVDRLREDLKGWLQEAEGVTLERVVDMERVLPPLKRAFTRFARESSLIDQSTTQNERARRELEQRRLEEQKIEDERRHRLRAILEGSERSVHPVEAHIRRQGKGKTLILRRKGDTLVDWTMPDGSRIRLSKRRRYLLVDQRTGRVSWPAVNKTRLTQFGSGLADGPVEDFEHGPLRVEFNALAKPAPGSNVELRLRRQKGGPALTVSAWFDPAKLELQAPVLPAGDEFDDGVQALALLMKDHRGEVAAALATKLLRPFKYKANLYGIGPSEFFGPGRDRFKIWLYRRADYRFLVVK